MTNKCSCKDCDCTYLFVYGTLKQGGPLNSTLNSLIKNNFGYVPATLSASALMYDLGPYPAVVLTPSTIQVAGITGEIVKLSERHMTVLDAVEGAFYMRTKQYVYDMAGNTFNCWLYHVNEKLFSKYNSYANSNIVTSGIWENY